VAGGRGREERASRELRVDFGCEDGRAGRRANG